MEQSVAEPDPIFRVSSEPLVVGYFTWEKSATGRRGTYGRPSKSNSRSRRITFARGPWSKNRCLVRTGTLAEVFPQLSDLEWLVTPWPPKAGAHGVFPGGVVVKDPTSTRPPTCGSGGAQLLPQNWSPPALHPEPFRKVFVTFRAPPGFPFLSHCRLVIAS